MHVIKEWFYDIKYRCQRFIRGYADCDVWNINEWFIKTLEPMLKELASTTSSSPYMYTYDQWVLKLNEMADALHFMLEDNIIEELEGGWDKYLSDISIEDYQRVSNTIVQNKDKFFEMFIEEFWSLWD